MHSAIEFIPNRAISYPQFHSSQVNVLSLLLALRCSLRLDHLFDNLRLFDKECTYDAERTNPIECDQSQAFESMERTGT